MTDNAAIHESSCQYHMLEECVLKEDRLPLRTCSDRPPQHSLESSWAGKFSDLRTSPTGKRSRYSKHMQEQVKM